MTNPFIRKLECFSALSSEHQLQIAALTAHVTSFAPRENIVREGDEPKVVNVVMSGWACRYKTLQDGRRQIVSLFLPGDMCDPYVFLLGAVDYAVATLTPCRVAKVSAHSIREITASGPRLAEALWWQTLLTLEIQREWTISLGRRTAVERLAHLFCEVFARLTMVGAAHGTEYELPLTQSELADVTGLSTVHVNRSLKELRSNGLIDLHGRRLMIRDHAGLMDLAMFDPTYLHHGIR